MDHKIRNVNYQDNKVFKDWIVFTTFWWCDTLSVALLHSKFQNFRFLSPTINTVSQSTEIWEMLTIPNYKTPKLAISVWNMDSPLI